MLVNRKSTMAEHDDECVHEEETTPVDAAPCMFTTDTNQVGTTPRTIQTLPFRKHSQKSESCGIC